MWVIWSQCKEFDIDVEGNEKESKESNYSGRSSTTTEMSFTKQPSPSPQPVDGCLLHYNIFYTKRSFLWCWNFFSLLFIDVFFAEKGNKCLQISTTCWLWGNFLHKSSTTTLFANTSSNFLLMTAEWSRREWCALMWNEIYFARTCYI